jgi:toxin ParE1/3/4
MDVVWTTPALDDLDHIQDYIALDSPITAYRFTSKLVERTETLLSLTPMAGRAGRVAGTREWVMPGTAYIVVYRVTRQVEILAIVNAAQEWPESF